MDRIILRQLSRISDNEIDTKELPLTASELDGNFIFVNDKINGTIQLIAGLNQRVTNLETSPGGGSIDLSDYYTKTEVDDLIPTVFSGDYNDLTNKPDIPTPFSGDYNDLTNKPDIPTPFSGDYNDLTNKPLIPVDINELTDTDGLLGSGGGSSYTDANVDTHLNLSSAASNTVLSWNGTDYAWVAQANGGGTGDGYDQSLNTTDSVEFASVTTSDLTIVGAGTTTINAGSNIVLDSPNRVSTTAPFKLATMDTAARDAIIATSGDMIYNTDVNKFQGYANGAWVDLH